MSSILTYHPVQDVSLHRAIETALMRARSGLLVAPQRELAYLSVDRCQDAYVVAVHQGAVEDIYQRCDRMTALGVAFFDVSIACDEDIFATALEQSGTPSETIVGRMRFLNDYHEADFTAVLDRVPEMVDTAERILNLSPLIRSSLKRA